MKRFIQIAGILLLAPSLAAAVDQAPDAVQLKHREGSAKLAVQQDELAADVQQLTLEQTVPAVIELLKEVGKIMAEATDQLTAADTGGRTLAAQTEIIEKIHAAAKQKQQTQASGQSASAMMDMLERMLGIPPDTDKKNGKGKGQDGEPSEQAGNGGSGLSDGENAAAGGQTGGKSEARRVPKASGSAGHVLPEEFKSALDAYNRGVEQKLK